MTIPRCPPFEDTGDWPESPSLRFVIWALIRKDEFCDSPQLCNDHPTQHAEDCPAAYAADLAGQGSAFSILLDQVLSLDFCLEKGITGPGTTLDSIPFDQYVTLRLLQSERSKHDREQLDKDKQRGPGR